jgi:hypothetical protein
MCNVIRSATVYLYMKEINSKVIAKSQVIVFKIYEP